MIHTPQTHPFTRYYLAVPGEHEGTWVPVRIGSSAVPQYWESRGEAISFAVEVEMPEYIVIEVTQRLV